MDSLKSIIWVQGNWIPGSLKGIIRFLGYTGIGSSRINCVPLGYSNQTSQNMAICFSSLNYFCVANRINLQSSYLVCCFHSSHIACISPYITTSIPLYICSIPQDSLASGVAIYKTQLAMHFRQFSLNQAGFTPGWLSIPMIRPSINA